MIDQTVRSGRAERLYEFFRNAVIRHVADASSYVFFDETTSSRNTARRHAIRSIRCMEDYRASVSFSRLIVVDCECNSRIALQLSGDALLQLGGGELVTATSPIDFGYFIPALDRAIAEYEDRITVSYRSYSSGPRPGLAASVYESDLEPEPNKPKSPELSAVLYRFANLDFDD